MKEFDNAPERRDFLRSDLSEIGELAAVASQYATAHPDVEFLFCVEGRKRWRSGGSGSLRAALADLYGGDVAAALLEVAAEAVRPEDDPAVAPEWVRVSGLISPPRVGRERPGVCVSVNGRPILPDRHLGAIISEVYHTLLPHDQHTIVALQIELGATSVDVASEPGKRRARFRDPVFVGRQVGIALHSALLEAGGARWQRGEAALGDPDGDDQSAQVELRLRSSSRLSHRRATHLSAGAAQGGAAGTGRPRVKPCSLRVRRA